ncbi:kinesin-like protein KIF21A, partial [Nothobranchius furzeri]
QVVVVSLKGNMPIITCKSLWSKASAKYINIIQGSRLVHGQGTGVSQGQINSRFHPGSNQRVLLLCPWARHLANFACCWWSEGPTGSIREVARNLMVLLNAHLQAEGPPQQTQTVPQRTTPPPQQTIPRSTVNQEMSR